MAQDGRVYQATATGCAFGLRAMYGPMKSYPMSKAWLIKGNLPLIPNYLHKSCRCEPQTKHAPASGANTEGTGRYTETFVNSVHSMFAKTVIQNNRASK